MWSEADIFKQKPRLAYYDELRSYGRDASGLTIAHIKQGRFAIDRVSLNGRFTDGMLLIDHFGMALLAGDVAGQLALQFGADKTFRLALGHDFLECRLQRALENQAGPGLASERQSLARLFVGESGCAMSMAPSTSRVWVASSW